MVNDGFSQSGDKTLKLTVSEDLTDFLHVDTDSHIIKS